MKILVTGSNGQLGRTIMDSCYDADHEFVFTAHSLRPGNDGRVRQLDITDREAVAQIIKDENIEIIINCAGYTDVLKAETESLEAFSVNASAVSYLAEAARVNNALLIHVSTDYVFDGESSRPYKEDDPAYPVSEYGRSKLAGEEAVMASGCRYLIFRTAWLFSPYGRNFVRTILAKSEQQPVLKVVCDQVGTPTYARDLVDAIFDVIGDGTVGKEGIYNYTNEGVCSWYDFAKEICDLSGTVCTVLPCSTGEYPSNVRRPAYSVLDKTKFKSTFGKEICHWKDSLSFCISEIEKFG